MLRIRPAGPDDASAWASVELAASPHLVVDADAVAHEMRTEPADARRLVAVRDGTVVGVGRSRRYPGEDHASVSISVAPAHRRRGAGRALLDALWPDLAGSDRGRVTAVVEDDAGSRRACSRWGFAVVRTFQKSGLDPRTVPPPPSTPTNVGVVGLEEIGPEPVWRAQCRVARDDPSGLTLPVSWEDWWGEWTDPRSRPEIGRAVLVDGELAAYTLIGVAGDRAWSHMTGTLPEHRGRGYALLAKQHALRAAAAAGVAHAFTGNDTENRPMLAVNQRLGYVLVARPVLAERALP